MEKYKKDSEISYTFGLFPTFELVKHKKSFVNKIYFSENIEYTNDVNKFVSLCKENNIEIITSNKIINKLADKQNIFCIGEFRKYQGKIKENSNHIVLVNPSDMGNLGTIMRTCLGFNHTSIAIIAPCCDIFNPKTIRASMGSIFSLNIQIFSSFEEYQTLATNNEMYPFMLQASKPIKEIEKNNKPHSLIFGNEATGLNKSFLDVGQSVIIEHSKNIDSLNLPISVSIALFYFS